MILIGIEDVGEIVAPGSVLVKSKLGVDRSAKPEQKW
jgi:hypothetical protein